MKKLFAILLALAMVFALAACNQADTPDTTAAPTTAPTEKVSEPIGTLYFTFGAAIEMVYDEEGEVLELTGKNEAGNAIAAACQNQLGKECVFAARAILRYVSDNQLIGDARTVAVRVGKGDPLPDAEFLETIITDCQYLADEECTNLKMVKIHDERLTEDGELNLDAAMRLASYFLGAQEADITGNNEPVDGVYTLSSGEKSCTVDAFTGLVTAK